MKNQFSKMAWALVAAGFVSFNVHAQVSVGFDPSAAVGNFQAPGNTNSNTAYTINMTSDATNVNLTLQTVGTPVDSTLNFTNLYFDTGLASGQTGSNLGFEIQNQDAFTPGVSNNTSDLNHGITFTQPTAGVWDITIPWSYFVTDPDGLGFTKITSTNDILRLDLSQSFGYSVAGGSTAYGPTELGEVTYQAAPEPSSYALAFVALAIFAGVARFRAIPRA